MKTSLFFIVSKKGFTLVELMVVVAIIGLLSSVAIPNFKKYQAKSKIAEAKLHLAAIYTAEASFFSDYNIYAACLSYMGYNPSSEAASRYYATGFPAGVTAIAASAVAAATSAGLGTTCNTTATPIADADFFVAGKRIGGAVMDSQTKFVANPAGTALAAASCINSSSNVSGACVNDQSVDAKMSWQAAAVGIISEDFTSDSTASGLNINDRKILRTSVQGH